MKWYEDVLILLFSIVLVALLAFITGNKEIIQCIDKNGVMINGKCRLPKELD